MFSLGNQAIAWTRVELPTSVDKMDPLKASTNGGHGWSHSAIWAREDDWPIMVWALEGEADFVNEAKLPAKAQA